MKNRKVGRGAPLAPGIVAPIHPVAEGGDPRKLGVAGFRFLRASVDRTRTQPDRLRRNPPSYRPPRATKDLAKDWPFARCAGPAPLLYCGVDGAKKRL